MCAGLQVKKVKNVQFGVFDPDLLVSGLADCNGSCRRLHAARPAVLQSSNHAGRVLRPLVAGQLHQGTKAAYHLDRA